MSEYFKGVTFANQHLSPADDAVIRRRLIADGVLTGCEISHSRDTLSMAPGYLMACGREILHPSAENWTVTYSPATSKTASGTVIALSDASSGPLQDLRIYGRTTQDGTPTPDNPVELVSVGDGGSVGVTVAGKNLLPYPYYQDTHTQNGGTFTVNTDRGVALSGTPTGYSSITLYSGAALGSGTFTFSVSGDIKGAIIFLKLYKDEISDGIEPPRKNGFEVTFNTDDYPQYTKLAVGIKRNSNGAEMSGIAYPQLELGSIATDYEPYTAQTLPISTPNGLPGIPGTSGGNYTDADGQQWICDEVDFARGVYVQNVMLVNAKNLSWRMSSNTAGRMLWDISSGIRKYATILCTHMMPYNLFENNGKVPTAKNTIWNNYGVQICVETEFASSAEWVNFLDENDVYIAYALKSPVETPIPEAELTAYAALHTNRPNTTVYNDAGAHMEVGYYPQDDAIPSNGYARTLLTVDLTRTAAADVFDQVNTSIEYADTEDGFPAPVQDDINSEGSVYQLPLAVVSIEDGAITGITDSIGNAEPI